MFKRESNQCNQWGFKTIDNFKSWLPPLISQNYAVSISQHLTRNRSLCDPGFVELQQKTYKILKLCASFRTRSLFSIFQRMYAYQVTNELLVRITVMY